MWKDMGLYWAWNGSEKSPPVPYTKVVKYATLEKDGVRKQIAYKIIDDGVARLVHQDEILKHLEFGYTITETDFVT